MSNNTVFKKATIESYKGINPEEPMVIVFPENQGSLMIAEGDQGVGKTSVLECFEECLGGVFPEYSINKKSGTKAATVEFEHEGVSYRTRLTKSSFKLERLTEIAGKDKWISPGEDKTLIRKLLPYGTSPHVLIDYNGEAQITWLKQIAGSNADDAALKAKHKQVYDNRTLINRDIKNLQQQLVETGNFKVEAKNANPTEDYQKILDTSLQFSPDEVIVIQEKVLSDLRLKEKEVIKAQATYDGLDGQVDEKEKEIVELEERIKGRRAEIEKINERKVTGKKWLDEHAELPAQIKEAEDNLVVTTQAKIDAETVIATNKIYKNYNAKVDESVKLDSELLQISNDRLAIAKSFTPPIEGFEVNLGDPDESKKGLFLNGINIAALSESERWDLVIKILNHYNITILFVENLSSLGSNAIKTIEALRDAGGFIFASQMKRSQSKISVNFKINEEIKDTTNQEEEDE